jgi:hypothetical protein
MAMNPAATTPRGFGPWNPGIRSQVPSELRPLCTIFRPQNVFTSLPEAEELHGLTGLDLAELVAFRPERLALHELLIRVTAELSVPDGSRIEDLGINFRQIINTILARYLEPRMDEIRSAYADSCRALEATIDKELVALIDAPAPEPAKRRIFAGLRRAAAPPAESDSQRTLRFVAEWEARAHGSAPETERAACRGLARAVSLFLVAHESLGGGKALIASLAARLAANSLGGEAIGAIVGPAIVGAAKAEGYPLLPRQERPVVMNTKGPSASGKSTLRPLQKSLAGDIGVAWSEFALISPDIWRKQLLDYATLGQDYKYAGAFTADELEIVDQKLDRYMARKAERGQMPHLLIDRFRFDSFAPDSDEPGSNLLTRFGRIVYLFFMITPPASLVERAWNRGLEFGRYKAVDDTLAHGVEAYSGMPEVFFTWALRTDKRVHFEFLDNSVRFGERPRTVAFGWNGELNVLDAGRMLDVERFRRVNIDATAPELLYRDASVLAPERNLDFLRQCMIRFAGVNFADQASGRIYLRLESGRPVWADPDALAQAVVDADTLAALRATVPAAFDRALDRAGAPRSLAQAADGRPIHTLGRWGDG